jgi:restriction system protein
MVRWTVLAATAAAALQFGAGPVWWAGATALTAAGFVFSWRVWRAFDRRAARRTITGLRMLRPEDFESEVARWLRRDGWNVEHRGGAGDGGIDLLARKRKETLAVQCKRYAESAAVSAAQVRDLYGAAVALGATGALLVTTGRVSGPALAWAEALPAGPAMAFHDANCLANVARGGARI